MAEKSGKKEVKRRDFVKGVATGVGATAVVGLGSTPALAADKSVKVLVLYYSRGGSTAKVATGVVKGVEKVPGATVKLRKVPGSASTKNQSVPDVTEKDMTSADCLILGSPVYYANPAAELLSIIQNDKLDLVGKFGGAFATGASVYGGMDIVNAQLLVLMIHKAMIVAGLRNEKWKFGDVGVGAATFPPSKGVDEIEMKSFVKLGESITKDAMKWKIGYKS